MAYTIKKSDGTVLVNLVDGTLDNKSTSITLIGKNVDEYGTALNTNFVRLLENFAGVTPPLAPQTGQLWYSTADGRLKVYTPEGIFGEISSSVLSATKPSILRQGDLWIDTTNDQLNFTKDGNTTVLAGPIYKSPFGKSGFVIENWKDDALRDRQVTALYSNGILVAVVSTATITFANTATQNTQGLFYVTPGITLNQAAVPNVRFEGTATDSTNYLGFSATNYLVNNFDEVTDSAIWIKNDTRKGVKSGSVYSWPTSTPVDEGGLFIGSNPAQPGGAPDLQIFASGSGGSRTSFIKSVNVDQKLVFRQVRTIGDNDLLTLQGDKVGINLSNPVFNLDVAGNTRITGNLQVTGIVEFFGTVTTVRSTIVQVADKAIELASSATSFTDVQVDGGGIILKGTTDKTWLYNNTSTSWQSNIDIDTLGSSSTYKIAGVPTVGQRFLGNLVTTTNITRLGVLTELTASNVLIKGTGITTNAQSLRISSVSAVSTGTGTVITVNLLTPAPLIFTGTSITISGVVDPGYDGNYQVRTVTTSSNNQFTILSNGVLSTTSPIIGANGVAIFPDLLLNSSANGNIDATNKRIINVGYPVRPTDAASVQFLQDYSAVSQLKGFVLSIDITNMALPDTDIAGILMVLAPPVNQIPPLYPFESQYDLPVGYRARVLCQRHGIVVPPQPINVATTSTLFQLYPTSAPGGAVTAVAATATFVTTTATIQYTVKEFRVVNDPPLVWRFYRDI